MPSSREGYDAIARVDKLDLMKLDFQNKASSTVIPFLQPSSLTDFPNFTSPHKDSERFPDITALWSPYKKKKKQKATSSNIRVHYLLSLCLWWTELFCHNGKNWYSRSPSICCNAHMDMVLKRKIDSWSLLDLWCRWEWHNRMSRKQYQKGLERNEQAGTF